jgi:molybdopterin synthase catalytic subunit/molybdopterin converting factor small subunit
MMKVRVSFFGPARDWAGQSEVELELPDGATAEDVIRRVADDCGLAADRRATIRLAIDDAFVGGSHVVREGDDISLIPPVSGGEDDRWVEIVTGVIDRDRGWSVVGADPACGGVVVFEGVTRAETHPEFGELTGLDYESHDTMAIVQMREIADRAMDQWDVRRLVMVHRVGEVGIGETSVLIATACPHRKDAFLATRFLIDVLKADVPIWKKEVWSRGTTSWVDPTSPTGR